MSPLATEIYSRIVSTIMFEGVDNVKAAMEEVEQRLGELYLDPTNQELLYGKHRRKD